MPRFSVSVEFSIYAPSFPCVPDLHRKNVVEVQYDFEATKGSGRDVSNS